MIRKLLTWLESLKYLFKRPDSAEPDWTEFEDHVAESQPLGEGTDES